MRWDNLFDDLEGQLEQERSAEEDDLQAEEERLRLGRLSLRDRMAAIASFDPASGGGEAIRLVLNSGLAVAVRPRTFGRDWLAGDIVEESENRAQCILPVAGLASLALTRRQVRQSLVPPPGLAPGRGITDRLSLAFVLRDLCRRRASLEVHAQGAILHGTLDRVGRDHCDLAVHEPGSPRRENEVTSYRIVPLDRITFIRL